MTRMVTVEERRARLARRHRLLPEARTDDLPAIADDLVALHSTDPATVHLSAMARMRRPLRGAPSSRRCTTTARSSATTPCGARSGWRPRASCA